MTEWHMMNGDINGNNKTFLSESDINDTVGSHRKVKRVVPDSEKDERYWEKRKRNNIAAKRSRENKRVVEISIRHKMAILEEENNLLKKEISAIKSKLGISPENIFLTDEDREKCRVKFIPSDKMSRESPPCLDNHPSREEDCSSPGSSVSACTSPRTITKSEFIEGYPREETFERSSPESALHFHKKKTPHGKLQQRIPGAFPFPQTLFYGSSYGAQLMWASARCPGPVGGMQQIYQEYALNNGTVSPPNNNPHNNNSNNNMVMPHSPFPQYTPTQIPTNTRPQDYFLYRSTAPLHGSQYDEMGEPTDLSASREKFQDHRHHVKSEDLSEVRNSYQQEMHSREEHPQVQGNTPKRRYSNDYSNNKQGNTGIAVHDMRAALTGHHTPEISHNYSTTNAWTEQRSSTDADQAGSYNPQQRQDDGYYDQGSGYQEASARVDASYNPEQVQPNGDNEQLRKENEHLKVGLRQLFSQVFKMKDIVLPN